MNEPSELIKSLRGSLEFRAVMEDMARERPKVMAYQVPFTRDDEYRQQMTLAQQTARQEGFDLLFRLLTGKRLDQRNINGDTHG